MYFMYVETKIQLLIGVEQIKNNIKLVIIIINCRFKSFFKNVKLKKLYNHINNMIGSSCLARILGYDGSAECTYNIILPRHYTVSAYNINYYYNHRVFDRLFLASEPYTYNSRRYVFKSP